MPELATREHRLGPQELVRAMTTGHAYLEAVKSHMSVSAWLEREDPSAQYGPAESLDAFERCLRSANIRTQSDQARGVWADSADKFWEGEGRALFPEWAARQWRRAATGQDVSTRALYGAEETGSPSVLQPITYAPNVYATRLAPAVPLSAVIAQTVGIDGATYEAFYLTDDVPNERTVRIGEGAEIPEAKLVGGDHTIRLKKYGRSLRVSYEMLRRQQIDLLAFHVQRLAIQTEVDKLAAAMDVAVNGDGNANTAGTSYNLSALDAAAAGTETLKAWLAWRLKFPNPYTLTTMLTQATGALASLLLSTGTANIPFIAIAGASNFGTITPINGVLSGNVAMGVTADAPANTLVGLDARMALGEVREIGGNVSEVDRFISNQTQLLTLTEVDAFWVIDSAAVRILNLAG